MLQRNGRGPVSLLPELADDGFLMDRLEVLLSSGALSVSLLMIGVDGLPEVRRRFGAEMADRVLRIVATTLRNRLRGSDCLVWLTSGRFVVLLPETSVLAASGVAQRLRSQVEALPLTRIDPQLEVSVAIGVAATEMTGRAAEPLFSASEWALQQAAARGGNCVAVFRSEALSPLDLPTDSSTLFGCLPQSGGAGFGYAPGLWATLPEDVDGGNLSR